MSSIFSLWRKTPTPVVLELIQPIYLPCWAKSAFFQLQLCMTWEGFVPYLFIWLSQSNMKIFQQFIWNPPHFTLTINTNNNINTTADTRKSKGQSSFRLDLLQFLFLLTQNIMTMKHTHQSKRHNVIYCHTNDGLYFSTTTPKFGFGLTADQQIRLAIRFLAPHTTHHTH